MVKVFETVAIELVVEIDISMGDNQCLSMDPDGICYGDAEKTDQTVDTIDQVTFSQIFHITLYWT